MTKACILIKTVPTATDRILEKVTQIRAVRKAFTTYGRWDIAAFVEASRDEIDKLSASINVMDGVRSTETLPEA